MPDPRVMRAVQLYARLSHALRYEPPSPRRTARVRALTRRIVSFLDAAPIRDVDAYYTTIRPIVTRSRIRIRKGIHT